MAISSHAIAYLFSLADDAGGWCLLLLAAPPVPWNDFGAKKMSLVSRLNNAPVELVSKKRGRALIVGIEHLLAWATAWRTVQTHADEAKANEAENELDQLLSAIESGKRWEKKSSQETTAKGVSKMCPSLDEIQNGDAAKELWQEFGGAFFKAGPLPKDNRNCLLLALICAREAESMGSLYSNMGQYLEGFDADFVKDQERKIFDKLRSQAENLETLIAKYEWGFAPILSALAACRNGAFSLGDKYAQANQPTAHWTAVVLAKRIIHVIKRGSRGDPKEIPVLASEDLPTLEKEIVWEAAALGRKAPNSPEKAEKATPNVSAGTEQADDSAPKKRKRRRKRAKEPTPLTPRQTEAMQLVAEHKGKFAPAARAAGITATALRKLYNKALAKLGKKAVQRVITQALPTDHRGQSAIHDPSGPRPPRGQVTKRAIGRDE